MSVTNISLKFQSCGGYCGAISILFLGACGILLSIGTAFIIMAWMRDQITTAVNNGEMNNAPYEIAFLCLWLLICLVGITKAYFMSRFLSKGDTVLHEEMVERLIKSPMLFYDTVSVGSIINRFVIDLDEGKSSFEKRWKDNPSSYPIKFRFNTCCLIENIIFFS